MATAPYQFMVVELQSGKQYKHRVTQDPSQRDIVQCLGKITALTAHPTEDCVAVGHDDGKINIWYAR